MFKIYLFAIFYLILNNFFHVQCSGAHDLYNPALQKKLQHKIKQDMHARRTGFVNMKAPMCESIENWHPIIKKERFFLTGPDSSTISSTDSFFKQDNCTIDSDLFEVTWRYEFFESMHCIRVEFDLGLNITNFVEKINYTYYGFTYRELGKQNQYLSRQPLNESVNTLTIKNANHRPYIICVTFYKNPYISIGTPSSNSNDSNETYVGELSCEDYTTIFSNDERTHDVNLCIDIDTQEHFLGALQNNHGVHSSEFIMVAFIFCLITFMLTTITIGHYIIQKPKKRKYLNNIRKYVAHKFHNQDSSNANANNNGDYQGLTDSTTSLKQHSKMSASSHKPTITISDFSSNASLSDKHIKFALDDPSETDQLLPVSTTTTSSNGPKISIIDETLPTGGSSNNPTASYQNTASSPSVTFHVGETIVEENEDEPDRDDENNNNDNNDTDRRNSSIKSSDNEKEAIKTISHLLDDKPWGPSRSNSVVASNLMGLQNRRFSEFDMARLRLHFNSLYNKTVANENLSNNPEPK